MLTVAECSRRMAVSQSLLYRLIADGTIECYQVGKSGIRLSWEAHILPYLERPSKKKPRPQRLSSKKATLKHLDLS